MKYTLFAFCLCCSLLVQSQTYRQRDLALTLDHGFLNPLKFRLDYKMNGNVTSSGNFGPLVLDAQYFLYEDFSVGLSYSYNEFGMYRTYKKTDYSDPFFTEDEIFTDRLNVRSQSFFVFATGHFSDSPNKTRTDYVDDGKGADFER